MRSSKVIILLGTLLQVVIFIGQRIIGQFFASQPLLGPLRGAGMVVGFVMGALIDIAVGFWFIRSKQEMPRRESQAIVWGSLAAISSRLMSTLVSILLFFVVFIGDESFFRDMLQDPARDAALLNIALVSIGPLCSSAFMGAIFGGLGGFMTKSFRGETKEIIAENDIEGFSE